MSLSPLGIILPAFSIGAGSLLIKPKRGFFPGKATDPKVVFKPFIAQVTIEEVHNDELEITEHPVEQNAPIADHAYKRPSEVVIQMAWSNSPSPGNRSSTGLVGAAVGIATTLGGSTGAAIGGVLQTAQSLLTGNAVGQVTDIYKQLLSLQQNRTLFDVFTGKRSYVNMLLRGLQVITNEKSERSLSITATCRQVILATTVKFNVNINPEAQADKEKTSPVTQLGTVNPEIPVNLTPELSSVSGATKLLGDTVAQATTMFNQVSGGLANLTGAVQGALQGVPEILGDVTSSLSSVLPNLPTSITIPSLSLPQSFSISLDTTLKGALETAYGGLPDVLDKAKLIVGESIAKLPGITSQLPTVLTNLPTVLSSVNSQLTNTITRIADSIKRAPLS